MGWEDLKTWWALKIDSTHLVQIARQTELKG